MAMSDTPRRQALARDRDRPNELSLAAEQTLAKACDDRVSEATSVALWHTFGHPRGITREAIRASLATSPEGLLLRRLSRSKWRAMPKSKGVAAIEGSPDRDSWAEALRVLHNGLPVPR